MADPLDLPYIDFVSIASELPPGLLKTSVMRWYAMRDMELPDYWKAYFRYLGI